MNHGKSIEQRIGRASVRFCPTCHRYTYDRMSNATDDDMADLARAITQLRDRVAAHQEPAPAGHVGY